MPRSANQQLAPLLIFSLFTIAFGSYLVMTAWYYLNGAENVTVKSFAPGVPAFFLFFMARKAYRSWYAAKRVEKRKRAQAD